MDERVAPHPSHDEDQPATKPRSARAWLRALGPLALALLLSIAAVATVLRYGDQLTELEEYGYLGAFIIGFLGNATVFLPAPSLALTTALGGIFNPVLVGVAAGAGEALGEMTGYLAGMTGKEIVVERPHYRTVCQYMERFGGWVIFVLAAVPNPLFDVAGITAGVVRYPVRRFLLSAWAGKTLKAILFAQAGRHFFS